MWQTYSGAGVLIVYDTLILMVYHKRSGKLRWELPSGLSQANESLEVTAIRETFEETNLSINIDRLFCTVVMDVPSEEYRAINVYYCASVVGKVDLKPPTDEPIEKVAFLDIASIKGRDIHPVDRKILARWQQGISLRPFYMRIVL